MRSKQTALTGMEIGSWKKKVQAQLSGLYHWTVGGYRFGDDPHPTLLNSRVKNRCQLSSGHTLSDGIMSLRVRVPADIVPQISGGTRINPNSSAPRQRSTARTVWVIATRDGVLQAESGELGRTGTTWTDCQVGLHGATGLSKPFPSCAPWPTHDGSWPHRERGVC